MESQLSCQHPCPQTLTCLFRGVGATKQETTDTKPNLPNWSKTVFLVKKQQLYRLQVTIKCFKYPKLTVEAINNTNNQN